MCGHLSAWSGRLSPGHSAFRLAPAAAFVWLGDGIVLAHLTAVISGTSSMDRSVARSGIGRRTWLLAGGALLLVAIIVLAIGLKMLA